MNLDHFTNVVKSKQDCKDICQIVLSYSRMNSLFKYLDHS